MNQRVLIIRNAYQKDTGGAEQYAFNLALALKRAGHCPVVVTKHEAIHKKCRAEDIKTIQGVWYEQQEWDRRYYLRYIYTTLWYMWIIASKRINVVHPQSRDDFVFASRAASLLRRRVIWTDHADLKYLMDRINHPHPRMQAWLLKAARRANRILCVSKSEFDSISAVAPEIKDRLRVIYNGVFIPQNVHPIPKKSFVIGTNARLVKEKGITEILQAFAAIKKPDSAELWLLGGLSGNEKHFATVAKDLSVESSVKFINYVPNPNDYVASMDIFVHASYHEAFSLAVIEACMLGRPIVATAVGGTKEIITANTGILVEPRSVPQLTKAIDLLLDNPKLRTKLGTAARESALKSFDFQKIVERQIIPLYIHRQAL